MEEAENTQFHPLITTFIFTAMKYNLYFHSREIYLFQINIIYNQNFPVFHFFVHNKMVYVIVY